MTPDAAAWVRAHVWTPAMRAMFREVPGFWLTCACQHAGPCQSSARHPDRHERCHVGTPLPTYETIIRPRGGTGVAAFSRPYRYPTASATGWHHTAAAQVWLADRRCAWRCACPCGHPRTDIAHAPARNPMRPIRAEQLDLLTLI